MSSDIHDEIKLIRKELAFIKEHMADVDSIMSEDDFLALLDYRTEKEKNLFLKKLHKDHAQRIFSCIDGLKLNPVPHDAKTVESAKEKLFRVRVGAFRILYEVDHKQRIIGIVKIDKRPRAYNK